MKTHSPFFSFFSQDPKLPSPSSIPSMPGISKGLNYRLVITKLTNALEEREKQRDRDREIHETL